MARKKLTDAELEEMWRDWGGTFHGPNVEHGSMPKDNLMKLLRAVMNGDLPKIVLPEARCPTCKGAGKYFNGLLGEDRPCPDCKGSGVTATPLDSHESA